MDTPLSVTPLLNVPYPFRGSIEPSGGFDRTFFRRSPISGCRFKIPSIKAELRRQERPAQEFARKTCEPTDPLQAWGQNPQNREKRVSSDRPEKGALSQNIPISLQGTTKKGIFGLKTPFSGAMRNGSFLTPKPWGF